MYGDTMKDKEALIQDFSTELRRGTIIMVVLSQLFEKEYGYSLSQKLESLDYPIETNTLYPLLRRLEKQNLLISEWDTQETRPRKFYHLSPLGKEVYQEMMTTWKNYNNSVNKAIGEKL